MTFKIPAGVLEQHVIALGKTGSGKSSKLRVLVEGLLDANEPVCILDVKGDWWGLKSSADGKRAGFPLVIFGGKHADVPLSAGGGKEIAELVFTGNRPCIIDMRALGQGERARFFIDLASTAYKVTKGKRWLVMSEVHNFCPKGKIFSPQAGEMLHWANKLASEGRGLGINLLADSQRGQKVHNDFLTSMETLVACKVIHKSDRDAIKDWIDGCADIKVGKQVLDSLAQLKKPEAWVWCPEIDFGPELLQFPLFKTFDSFKPQQADAPAQLKGWADVDLSEVTEKLAKVVEETKANDPAALKKQIAELQRQLKATPAAAAAPVDTAALERHCYAGGFREGQESIVDQIEVYYGSLEAWSKGMPRPPVFKLDAPTQTKVPHKSGLSGTQVAVKPRIAPLTKAPHRANGHAPASDLPKGEIAILSACIQYPEGLRREQLTVLTGFKRSTRDAYVYRLKEKGFVDVQGDTVTATEDGMLALPNAEPLPRGEELQQFWLAKLPQGERLILEQLIEVYPDPLGREELTTRTGFKRSTRDAYIYRMASKQIVTEPSRGNVRASEDLF